MRETKQSRYYYRQGFVRQSGQALIYGIFVLLGGIAALFFLFNSGQISSEKTKLVNAADAVAYSSGVMHARALNFDAYTNRALMANEVMIAQMVSVSSWLKYSQEHVNDVPPLNCYTIYSVPVALALAKYAPLCYALSWQVGAAAVQAANQGFAVVGPVAMAAAEVAKAALKTAQTSMYASFLPARTNLMREVANANYQGDGVVSVDPVPLVDHYALFDGQPFIMPRAGNDRARFRAAELAAAHSDGFVKDRSWSDTSPWPCNPVVPKGRANRTGSTTLLGFDEWKANDEASLRVEQWKFKLFSSGCKKINNFPLGTGNQAASASGGGWYYSGVPTFYELSNKALAYTPSNPNAGKRDPRLQFAVRLTRAKAQAKTSAGRSEFKPSGAMEIYQGSEAGNVMAAVATSEVYFERPTARADGKKELPSLFNPYWQVRLIGNSAPVLAAALALQGGPAP